MADLALILTDFVPAAGPTAEPLPRLPALELLLARAECEALEDGWRGWLRRHSGSLEDVAAGELAALAFADRDHAGAQRPGRVHYWLATPLHFFAGIDSVHLHPQGVLRLSDSEQQWLVEDFARAFADAPWRLAALGQRELLLVGPPLLATAAEPECLLRHAPDQCVARGPDRNALRRLGSEIELWLHEHPLNLERVRREQLPLTALWLWGGRQAEPPVTSGAGSGQTSTAASALPAVTASERLFGDDTYATALWRLRAEAPSPLPPDLVADTSLLRSARGSVVLRSMHRGLGVASALLELEQRWLAPAVAAVQKRHIGTFCCLLGEHAYRLTWQHCIRVWRRRAPWWEGLR